MSDRWPRKLTRTFVHYGGRPLPRWHAAATLLLEPRDLWLGVFWRRQRRDDRSYLWHVYVCLIPCVPLHVTIERVGRVGR